MTVLPMTFMTDRQTHTHTHTYIHTHIHTQKYCHDNKTMKNLRLN